MQRDLDIVSKIVLEAGRIVLEVYAKDFAVAYKGVRDPVTEADARANAYIVDALREAFPGDGVVGEESEDKSDALKGGRVWYVDPLDGTKEFIKKNGEFAVMIGLAIDGEARLGVVFQPAKDKLYAGIVGEGAWLQTKALEGGGERRSLKVSATAEAKNLRLVVSRSHRAESTDMLVKRLGITQERQSGSVGLKVGLIAEQVVDLYVHPSDRTKAWDACGPEAVLRAAGGRFCRLDGQPYRYGGEDLRTEAGILACNAAAFDHVLPAATEVAKAIGFLN